MIINVNDGQYIIEVNFNLYNGGTNLLTLYAYSNSTNEEINIDEINYNEVLNIYLNSMEYDIFELQFINLGDNPQKYGQTFVIEYKLNLNNLSLELVDFQPSNYFEEYDKLDISITKLEEPTPTETTTPIITPSPDTTIFQQQVTNELEKNNSLLFAILFILIIMLFKSIFNRLFK